ncbi:PREDICTED: alpha-2-macroglobulin receptor-associated protein isoform X2 [Colobus angolensis palliatus]|uniref:Alpha-2-macroglobulin receptor-associated protein n=1 Tax=Colobus angolensis palliatus TaxID=336983 RepID=A0A2K5HII3_COLAP|nr:PREDICTED: alpha-2-macroglobulin receptor-associated protein isoform X2 [Colobus angolensis palliatus]
MASQRLGLFLRGLPALVLLLLLVLVGPWPAASHGGKYSREKNQPEPPPKRESGEEFRMEKLNQLWEKAQRLHLSPVRLAELHADLKIQERDELAWKKLKLDGLDKDGEKEARLIRNLNVILAKYGLDGKKDARQVTSNSLSGTQEDGLDDPRLEKLWHKAKTSGKFSSEELDKLWREFLHHKEKVHEYNVLLETLSRTEEIHENVISPLDLSDIKGNVLHSRHAELKEKLRSINQGLERLRRVSRQGYSTDAEFEEPRVIDLWDLAQSANLTDKELEALREELKHFEAKIEKHNHYQKQLEIAHEKLRHAESVGDGERVSRSREKHTLLEGRTKELGYTVKKHLQDLSSRISRARHNEL